MADKKSKTEYDIAYAKEKLKRIPLDVRKEEFEIIKAFAESKGLSVNGFIKQAIWEALKKDAPGNTQERPL